VEESRRQRGSVQAHIRQDVRDFQEVGEIRFAGIAELVAVALGGDIVGPADQPGIFGRTVQAELLKKLFQSAIELPLRAVTVEIKGRLAREPML